MILSFIRLFERKILFMKKTKILVPALAVLALGVAASVSGTFAWFTTTAATAKKSTTNGTETIVANTYSNGAVTFTLSCAFDTTSGLDLTDDYGLTYYYNGSVKTLDVAKTNLSGTALTAGSDYVKLTVTLAAQVESGSVANGLNSYGAISNALSASFSVTGDAAAIVKYSAVGTNANPSLPTQAAISTTSGTNCGTTSTGETYYYDNSSTTWANVTPSANSYSLTGAYANSSATSITLATWVYYVGLSGADSDQSDFANTDLSFVPSLTSNSDKIAF